MLQSSPPAGANPVNRTGLSRYPVHNRARVIVALIPCLLGILIAGLYLRVALAPGSGEQPFTDATTYLAAGERLNAGHDLYELHSGDRMVVILPWISNSPLLSPPPIAVLWRPIAALPFGYSLWIVSCWLALLGTTFYLVWRAGLPGALFATLLSPAIGEQLAEGNVAAFFPLLFVLAWRLRARPVAGAVIAVAASLKLTPVALIGWLVASRRWVGLQAAGAVIGLLVVLSVLGSSPAALVEYFHVAMTAHPSISSLSGLSGISWLSPLVLVSGALLAATLGRWPRVSFVVAVTTSVVGTPALYLSGWVAMLAVMAPFAEPTADALALGLETQHSRQVVGAPLP